MTTLHLSLPPNIFRKTTHDISSLFPGTEIRAPQTHGEMDDFYRHAFGVEHQTADLTVTAYPAAYQNIQAQGRHSIFRVLNDAQIPLRPELVHIGYNDSIPVAAIVAIVPLVIIHHRSVSSVIRGWADLCRDDLIDSIVIPPQTTPVPALYASYMEHICGRRGQNAARKAHARLLPHDINRAVDSGQYQAGIILPAFARTFRQGNALKVWPREGAITQPLVAFIKKTAPQQALDILDYLLGEAFQSFVAQDGLLFPVRPEIPLFEEIRQGNGRLHWLGWENYALLT